MLNQNWMERADKVIMHTYGRQPLVLVKGEGCRVWDDTGKEYLDCLAGLAVVNLGHAHPEVAKAAAAQLTQLVHVSNIYYTTPMVDLAEALVQLSFADRVFFANSGAEAVEIFRQHQGETRMVLCDLSMPRMTGWETITALREIDPAIRVILASGYNEAQVMQGEHPEKPQAFLHKPYTMDELQAAVGAVLQSN